MRFFFFILLLPALVHAVDFTGEVKAHDASYFVSRDGHPNDDLILLDAHLALSHNNEKNWRWVLNPRLRLGLTDHDLNRYLPREAVAVYYTPELELTVGLQKYFWGISHAFNPTQVINHRDFAFDFFHPENEADLVSALRLIRPNFGPLQDAALEFIVLPLFLKSHLPELDSRFAVQGTEGFIPFTLSDRQEIPGYARQIAGAVSVKGSLGRADTQFIYYHGLDHNPGFVARIDSSGALRITPFYYTVDMVGFNGEIPLGGPFLFHLESAIKITAGNSATPHDILFEFNEAVPQTYAQFVPGLDAVFDKVWGGRLTASVEYFGDTDRGRSGTFRNFRPFQNDLFLGLEHRFLDHRQTQIKIGWVKDLENREWALEASASTHLHDKLTAEIGATVVNRAAGLRTPISLFDNNSSIRATLAYSFDGKLNRRK